MFFSPDCPSSYIAVFAIRYRVRLCLLHRLKTARIGPNPPEVLQQSNGNIVHHPVNQAATHRYWVAPVEESNAVKNPQRNGIDPPHQSDRIALSRNR